MSFVTCPGGEALERFAQGALADHEAKPLERHLHQCAICVQQLQALLQNRNTVADHNVAAHLHRLEALLASRNPASGELTGPADATEGLDAGNEDPAGRLLDFLAPAQAADELGRLGKYRILQVIGHGGMGVVFKAEDIDLQRIVAIKAMLPALAGGPRAARRFQREARALAAVEHDHIVRIYQVDEDRGVPFLAMEFLKGEALDRRLQPDCALPTSEVIRIGREVAEALATAHARGLIHRDVKPANIWLEAPRDRVKLVDFGLARAGDGEAGITQEGAIVGTPAYMSPEQARGENVDARSDLFSLGVVLYRLCSGRRRPDTPEEQPIDHFEHRRYQGHGSAAVAGAAVEGTHLRFSARPRCADSACDEEFADDQRQGGGGILERSRCCQALTSSKPDAPAREALAPRWRVGL